MQSNEALPLQTWGQALRQARTEQGLDLGTIARELMLSLAQIRCIEAGEMTAFHHQGYYLRGVQKYADRLQISLEPPISAFEAASGSASTHPHRVTARASGIARRQSSPPNAAKLPNSRTHGAKLGRLLMLLLLALIGGGVYLAISEGWPSRSINDMLATAPEESTTSAAAGPAAVVLNQAPSAPVKSSSPDSPSIDSPSIESPSISPEAPAHTVSTPGSAEPQRNHSTGTELTAARPAAGSASGGTGDDQASASPQLSATTPQAVQTPVQAEPVPDEIVLTFRQECWVELRKSSGESEQGLFKPGQTLRFMASQVERLVLGNAQGVEALRAGKPYDVMQFTRGGNNVARIDTEAIARTAP